MGRLGPVPCTGISAPTGLSEFYGRVDYTETVDVANNESDIAWKFYAYVNRREYVTSFYSSGMNYVTISTGNSSSDCYVISGWNNKDIGPISFGNGQPGDGRYSTNPILLASGTIYNIKHNNDGTKRQYFKAEFSIPKQTASYLGRITVEGMMDLTDIPRSSTITSVTNVNIGEAPVVKWTPALSTYTFRVSYSCGNWSYEYPDLISPGSTSEHTFNSYTIPSVVAEQITKAKSGTGTCKIETFSDAAGTQSLGVSTKTFTITVPSSFGPTANIYVTAVNKLNTYALTNVTYFTYDASGSTTQAGATIVSGLLTVVNADNTIVYTSASLTGRVEPVRTPGMLFFSYTVTDSRGYSDTTTPTFMLYEYNKPSIVSALVTRGTGTVQEGSTSCSDFVVDEGGGNVARITYTTSHTAFPNPPNILFVSISYIKDGRTVTTTGLQGGTNVTAYFKPSGGGFNPDESYTFIISVYDTVTTSAYPETMTVTLSAASFPIDVLPNGDGIAFGKVADEVDGVGVLDSAWDLRTEGTVEAGYGDTNTSVLSGSALTFYNTNGDATGKFTRLSYGVMFTTCEFDDFTSSELDVADLFGVDIKAVVAVTQRGGTGAPYYFWTSDDDPGTYSITLGRVDGGTIDPSTVFEITAIPA